MITGLLASTSLFTVSSCPAAPNSNSKTPTAAVAPVFYSWWAGIAGPSMRHASYLLHCGRFSFPGCGKMVDVNN